MARVIDENTFTNAEELKTALGMLPHRVGDVVRPVMYVKDARGNTFTGFHLVENVLTDGSKTYDVILCTEA